MEPVGLAQALKELASDESADDYEVWAKVLRPLLPEPPLRHLFLEKVLSPLDMLGRTTVLDHLARLGRKEIAAVAAGYLAEADGFNKMYLAEVLIRCGEARGYDILEELYIYSLEHPDDKPRATNPGWIFDALVEFGEADPRAMELRRKLVAYEAGMRNKKA